MSFVDYRDVAEVAALALAGDDLVDGAFELAAGGMLTRTEIAAMISRHAGRTVLAEDVDPDVALGGMPAGAMRDGLTAMFADYTAYGFRGGNNLVLRTVLGRAPRTLDSYLGELAESAPTTSPNRVGAPASGGSAGGGRLNAVCQADACANAAGSIAAGSGEPMLRCWLLAAAKSRSSTTPTTGRHLHGCLSASLLLFPVAARNPTGTCAARVCVLLTFCSPIIRLLFPGRSLRVSSVWRGSCGIPAASEPVSPW
jgi:hypothetical protein